MLIAVAFNLILYGTPLAVGRCWILIGGVTLAVSPSTISRL
jgi:hypothetical protein